MRAKFIVSPWLATILIAVTSATVLAPLVVSAQSVVVGRNSNAVGPFAEGFYSGIPHYQDNEPHCDRNPLLPSNIVCMVNGYNGTEDLIGDSWPKILETQDNARSWVSRFASGHAADPATDLGLGFGADPIMVCFPGGCAGFFIASTRSEGGGVGGGVYMELMPELNIETGFRHYSLSSGPRTVQLGTGDNFLDKIDAIFIPDTQNPGTVSITEIVSLGNGETREVTREWPKGRFIVVYASFNSSNQNVRIFSTYSDDYGLNWDPPKQVAQTTGLDTGVATTAIDDTVLYAYRQFEDGSGGQTNAIFAAVSSDRGKKIGKAFPVFEDFCPFDQSSLPNQDITSVVTPRTNNFVDVSNDGENFVMVLASRLEGPNGCLDPSFDYLAGSRVLVTAAKKQNPKNWSSPVEIASVDPAGPAGGHSFQFMPAVDCVLGDCQSIWYDSFRDSVRNISWLQSEGTPGDVAAFKSFPLFGDFLYQLTSNDNIIQFRRTADIYGRQFEIASGRTPEIIFKDNEPQRITRFQLFAPAPATDPELLFEIEQLPAAVKQYGGNTVPFLGDYINLASKKFRVRSDSAGPNGEPHYESNAGADPTNPNLRAKWWASWTDTRNAAGQLYTDSLTEALPFAKSPTSTTTAQVDDGSERAADTDTESRLLSAEKELGAEGVEDSGTPADACIAPSSTPQPGDTLFIENNKNRIKDADIFGALIEQPATAWVLNGSKGFGPGRPQRAFVIAARNESKSESRTFRFEVVNQPDGFDENTARASWLQLPFENFDNATNPPDPSPPDETVGPQSSVTVALFVVSQTPVNPVKVNVYDVIADPSDPSNETLELVETLTVNGEVEAGPLVTPFGVVDVNQSEIHNPFVYDPFTANPAIWNPAIWNPAIWNPAIWNPAIWNPAIWNPAIWNPAIWNPAIWNPAIWNPTPVSGSTSTLSTTTASSSTEWDQQVVDANFLDNPEIPEPDLANLDNPDAPLVAKIDVQFGAGNQGNTLTPYVADFAVNSPIVRELLANNELATQLIVWEDARETSFQGCTADVINGQNRVLAVANNPDLLNLKVPDIVNNRFGSVTYYLEPGDQVYLTLRFLGSEAAIRQAADALFNVDGGGISYVVTSQAANTGSLILRTICTNETEDEICDQAIKDLVPPTLSLNLDPVELPAVRDPAAADPATADIGAILPAGLVTATGGEFEGALPVTCSSDDLAEDVLFDPDAPADQFVPLALGTSVFSCSATRNGGTSNEVTASVEFDVTVEDREPPVFVTTPVDQTAERELAAGTVVTFDAAATDNIDGDVPVTCTPVSSGGIAPFNPPGDPTGKTVTDVTCTAEDGAGNSAQTGFTVTVEDTTAPVIASIGNRTEEATSPDGADITILEPAVTEVGSYTLACIASIDGNNVNVIGTNRFPIGSTLVNCNAEDDAGNPATTVSFAVNVEDTTAPVITAVADITEEANTTAGANVSFAEPTATDFGGTVTLDVNCDKNPAGDFYPLYGADGGPTTLVTCSATDGFNIATGTFDVTIVDTTAPALVVPDDITVDLDGPDGTVVTFDVAATDIADADPTVTCTPPSGSLFPEGTTAVDCDALDASGNRAVATFTVTVEVKLIGSGLSSNKNTVNAGSVAPFTWSWTDASGTPVDVGDGNQDIEARLGRCPSDSADVLDEDPGSSGFQKMSDNSWQYNWQTVDAFGNPIETGRYCVTVRLLTTGQEQSTEIRVR